MEPGEPDWVVIADSVKAPEQFAVLYERHLRRIGTYLARRVGSALAEDLASEVFVRAFGARARYRRDFDTALPWLMGIANNLVADHRRAERRRLSALERSVHLRTNSSSEIEVADVAVEVLEALRRLAGQDRDALLLVVWGELSYEEAAAALGIPVGTVRSRISRARSSLAAVLGPSHEEHAPGGSLTAARNGETDG
jgi:RNA polymerase sigma factor (sigma-70 family)